MGNLVFEQIRVGGDRNFGYLFGDRQAAKACVIDPSYNPEALLERAQRQGLRITHLFNTHGHHDHVNGNEIVVEKTGAKVVWWGQGDNALADGASISIGQYELQILHTPGHSQDHVVLYNPTFGIAFTGDHLFVGKIGGTATEEGARQQYEALQRLLRELPPETTIWPGHDVGCRPSSTLRMEASANPFLEAKSFKEFLQIKQGWSELKKEKGLL